MTTSGLPIPAYEFGSNGPRTLIVGGVHGDESEGVKAAFGLLQQFGQSFPFALRLTLVPALNLDGVLAQTRLNARGVDLNRNLPTSDWITDVANPRYYPGTQANSESENHALLSYLETHKPRFIMSLHSWKPCLNVNGKCRKQAEAIATLTSYEIIDSIGYPTPGCLGTFAGIEHEMPTLTYEIERGLSTAEILRVHVPAMIEALKVTERPI
jgi:protein MpaA